MRVGGFCDPVNDHQFSKNGSEPRSQKVVTTMKGQEICNFCISTMAFTLVWHSDVNRMVVF